MEKRILLAAVISAMIMVGYAQMLSKYTSPATQQRQATPPASAQRRPTGQPVSLVSQLIDTEEVVFINSSELQLELGTETASVRRVVLKEFKDLETGEPLAFGGEIPVLALQVGGGPLAGELVETSARRARWNATDRDGNDYHITMELDNGNSLLYLELESIQESTINYDFLPIELISGWNKGDELGNRYNQLEIILLTRKEQPFQWRYVTNYGTQRASKYVPRGTYFVTLSDRYFCQSVKTDPDQARVTLMPSPEGSIATKTVVNVPVDRDGHILFSTEIYLGTRKHFLLKRAGFGEAFKLGFIGRIGITLLAILNWIAGITNNYGAAIIIFSMMVTGALAPFTLMSMKSMRKMQELKPEIDKIMAKQKSNPQKANTEMMALYKEHKVSPLSGCLPMMLQFPVLIALFQSITHFVELRGQGFLWIKDLSLPDRVAQLPFSLPLLGSYINVLPVIMTFAMLVQMKASQKQMPAGQSNPMTKMMSGPMMSILFGFMFYQFPSGLVLYWLTNSLMTLVWYRVART